MNHFFDAGKLADDLQNLVREAEELLRATVGGSGERVAEARERAEEQLSAIRERIEDLQGELKGRARDVDEYVRDNPWQAVAIAGGVALLIGLIMGRR